MRTKSRRSTKLSIEECGQILQLFADGGSVESLAQQFRVSTATINSVIYRKTKKAQLLTLSRQAVKRISQRKTETSYRNRCGNRNGKAKLSLDEVVKIKQLLKEEELSQRKIADMFGVNSKTISMIYRGESWSWVGKEEKPAQTVDLDLKQTLYSSSEAAHMLGYALDSLYGLLRRGKLKGKRRDGRWYFSTSQIEAARAKCPPTTRGRKRKSLAKA